MNGAPPEWQHLNQDALVRTRMAQGSNFGRRNVFTTGGDCTWLDPRQTIAMHRTLNSIHSRVFKGLLELASHPSLC